MSINVRHCRFDTLARPDSVLSLLAKDIIVEVFRFRIFYVPINLSHNLIVYFVNYLLSLFTLYQLTDFVVQVLRIAYSLKLTQLPHVRISTSLFG